MSSFTQNGASVTIMCADIGTSEILRTCSTNHGESVMFGTKWPSITSMWYEFTFPLRNVICSLNWSRSIVIKDGESEIWRFTGNSILSNIDMAGMSSARLT